MTDQEKRQKPELKLLLAAPRGFCAGVDRAVLIVERALEKFGAPVYVRHEIVHNRHVVDRLADKGAVFVEELEDIPDELAGKVPVIFSAHGVPKSVTQEADKKQMTWLDATCPLVSKVHIEAERHFEAGRQIIMIGHAGHPEVIGTMGQLPNGAIILIENTDDAETVTPPSNTELAYITQTTLSVDDTKEIIKVLERRFPAIKAPHKEDICYATTNRQAAVKAISARTERMFVLGAPNSSNSMRLVEVAERNGCHEAGLIAGPQDIDLTELENITTLGLTAGASAPESLVQQVIDKLSSQFALTIEEVTSASESVEFKLPVSLRDTSPENENPNENTGL